MTIYENRNRCKHYLYTQRTIAVLEVLVKFNFDRVLKTPTVYIQLLYFAIYIIRFCHFKFIATFYIIANFSPSL